MLRLLLFLFFFSSSLLSDFGVEQSISVADMSESDIETRMQELCTAGETLPKSAESETAQDTIH
jgi:hypothetical protein